MILRFSPLVVMVCLAVLIGSVSGCATFQSPFAKKIPTASAKDPVVSILCLWQPGEGHDPEGYPCKGFSGQILFLSNRASTPVRVEGEVRIYLFDDQGTAEEQTKPLRQFDFDKGSWDIHLAQTSLGPTYSVFVPYVRRGVSDAQCTLRVRLKPKFGPVVLSDFSNMPLNGTRKSVKGNEAKPIKPDEVEKDVTEELASRLRRTTTISMVAEDKSNPLLSAEISKVNPIQLVSHEVETDSTKSDGDAERIRRLEAMVQQLLEQKAGSRSTSGSTNFSNDEPARLDQDSNQSAEELKPTRRFSLRKDDEQRIPTNSVKRRQAHPLDDDGETSAAKTRKSPKRDSSDADPFESDEESVNESADTMERVRYRRSER